ncbi:MAG: hypothetical protein QME68_04990, partial [Elusimicrobiota bacterium]|nr:hypothetical protein [Elusimicrobiota bacterium]
MKYRRRLLALLLTFQLVFYQFTQLYSIGTPAGTIISSGGDRGISGVDDMPGDTIVTYFGGVTTYVTSNIVDVKVSTGYAISSLPEFEDEISVRIGHIEYIPCNIYHYGNATDVLTFSFCTSAGQNWQIYITSDTNHDGIHQPEETAVVPDSVSLLVDTTFYFFIAVKVSSYASIGETYTVEFIVKNQNGIGAEDNWPLENGNDSRTRELKFVAVPADTKPPAVPVGLKTTITEDKKSVILSWSSNTESDICGYFIYRAASIQELVNISTYSYYRFVTTNTLTDEFFGDAIVYYKVRSVDKWWNTSEDSMYIDNSEEGNIVSICTDESNNIIAELIIPKDTSTGIYKDSNIYGEDLHMKIQRLRSEESANDIGVYELKAYKNGNLDKVLEKVQFGTGSAELRLYYTESDL